MKGRGSKGSRRPKSKAAHQNDWRNADPNHELEKSRYAEPIASREMLLTHLSESAEPLSIESIAKRLGLEDKGHRAALGKRLAAMVREGQAIETSRGFEVAG